MNQPQIRAFFDEPTKTVSYLVWDPASLRGVVIDAVRDFDAASGAVGSESVDAVLAVAKAEGVIVEWALETHVHADHLSGAPLVKARTGARIAIGSRVCEVQDAFGPMFGVEPKSCSDTFDRLLVDGDRIWVGEMEIEVLHVPGHTPADVAYRIGDAAFVGDTLFMPDFGTARTDFPGGCAHQLYRSIRRLLDLPPKTRLFLCHDYKAPGRDEYAWETTVAAQRADNKHVHDGVTEEQFVSMRQARDAQLPVPALLIPAIQCNIRAGWLPSADAGGARHLRVPLSLQPGAAPDALD